MWTHSRTQTKAPKIRFRPGMMFHYDGDIWELIYMYRLTGQQGIWFHCLEEQKKVSLQTQALRIMLKASGHEYRGTDIIMEPFRSETDARDHFRNRMMMGNQCTKTTQQLIQLRRAEQ